ncbi:DinB family protein [Bacillus suaedae]|uniref:DinB family protein n=1 Tax=Halalkalibacter suaedae TaxID=2822140 RepID=A0A941AT31_9BACI|nr:DinB family protein [Bacillus suaedae]MBP3950744.1 DinB family protein [Bacillus suaedae]
MENKLKANEYPPFYGTYIKLLPDGDLIEMLVQQIEETITMLQSLSDKQALFRYGPDKWSIKEVIGHIIDTEQIMAYRFLCIARGEVRNIPGFNENEYVQNASFDQRSLSDLIELLTIIRQATIQSAKNLTSEEWIRSGIANDSPITVRALIAIIAGHERHHRNILNDRYINSDRFPDRANK